jgi:hypothetical protein
MSGFCTHTCARFSKASQAPRRTPGTSSLTTKEFYREDLKGIKLT